MVQFNFNRFKQLACWSLTNDKSYFLRNYFQVLVSATLVFLAFTTGFIGYPGPNNHNVCGVISLLMMGGAVVVGPSMMFQSMKGKHSTESLLMLPASNFEKYLMRWATWLILLPITIMALFTADLIQYFFNLALRTDYVAYVVTDYVKMVETVYAYQAVDGIFAWETTITWFIAILWLQSFYAVGGTFFRSHKYAWILTTISIILFFMITSWIFKGGSVSVPSDDTTLAKVIIWTMYVLWIVFNYWLSYRFFCRTQVIGKWVNL